MPHSVLDAIRLGHWDFEPESQANQDFRATGAMPGSTEKLAVLADRVRRGLPLWHPEDRRDYDEPNGDRISVEPDDELLSLMELVRACRE